jgi:quercetin dioxygenase-like cupin family protein
MTRTLLLAAMVPILLIGFAKISHSQTVPENKAVRDKDAPNIITLEPGEPALMTYDAGTARFLATSDDTNGKWSLVELQEMPGYHTNLHRHNHTDEAFYVLEGVLTVNMNGKISEYPAGSYVLVPRGTPHAQGNHGKVPARILLTMTPGGFERSFRDRAELFKTVKPSDPDFRKKRQENAVKGSYDVEFLTNWALPK